MKSSQVFRLSFILIIFLLAYCSIENYISEVASVITEPASSVTDNSAITGGEVTDDGGADVTSRGVRYTRRGDPDFVSYWDSTHNGSDIGVFTSNLTGLKSVSTYYVRAYAYNKEGIAFGNMIDFTTSGADAAGSFTDPRDGATYHIIRIGDQHWMKENLAYASANGSWFLRGCNEAGKLKQESTLYWKSPNEGANNLTGFTALPGGFYTPGYDSFEYMGDAAYFWTDNEYSDNTFHAIIRAMDYRYRRVSRETDSKNRAFSVRCIKN